MINKTPQSGRSRGIYLLPNLFTLTALFSGFYAIIAAMKGDFSTTAVAILIAMVMDTLDGRVARLTNTQTNFGAELDSLSDMVCFGIAPALFLYSWGLHNLGKLGWLAAFIYAAAVALRLARFNTQQDDNKRYFKGLPCPAGASVVTSLIWCLSQFDMSNLFLYIFVAVVAVCVAGLMISNLLFESFKQINLKNKVPFVVLLVVLLILVFVSVDPPMVWLIISTLYACSGPVSWGCRRWRKRKHKLTLDHTSSSTDN